MDKVPASIDEGLELILNESRARGLMHLSHIYGRIFDRAELLAALEVCDLNIERAAEYLQDRLPSEPQTIDPVIEKTEEPVELAISDAPDIPVFIVNQVPGPTSGKIALEFSQSPQYIDSAVPVFYITDEIIKEIFSFLHPWERAKLSSICRSWQYIDEKTQYLYKRDCINHWTKTCRPETNIFRFPFNQTEELWGQEYPKKFNDSREYIKSFKNWRNMWVKRAKVRHNGVYTSRISYFKQGQVNLDNLPSYHKIVYFRYLRFYSDFSVCCCNTTKKPREYLRLVRKENSEARLGEWARAGNTIIVHLLAKEEVFTYTLELKSSQPHFFDVLKLLKVESRSPGNTGFSEFNINSEAWPKFFKFLSLRY